MDNIKVGYRNDELYGSGTTDIKTVVVYETLELYNTDIPYTILTTFNISKEQKKLLKEFITLLSDGDCDDSCISYIDLILKIIYTEYPGAKYCLWLCRTEKDVEKYYEGDVSNISAYEIEFPKPISELGEQGALYVFSQKPQKIQNIMGNMIDGIIVYRGEERSRINRFDNVDDEGNPVLYNDVGFSGLFFSVDENDAREYGRPHKYKISSKAKIYEGYSSEEYCHENNLREIKDDNLYRISDGHTLKEIEELFYAKRLDDMNSIYGARQYMAKKQLEKQGYDGAHWEYEDDLTPEQYQIWNPSMITYIGAVDEFDEQ